MTRIALDIDSTLHHYWDLIDRISQERFGVELPYEEQHDWGVTRLKPKQLEVCIAETHSDDAILAGQPYPGAVETVRRWPAADTSTSRSTRCGYWIAVSAVTKPPIELPTSTISSRLSCSQNWFTQRP